VGKDGQAEMENGRKASFAALEAGRSMLTEAAAQSDQHRHGAAVVFGHLDDLITLRCAPVSKPGPRETAIPRLGAEANESRERTAFPCSTTATSTLPSGECPSDDATLAPHNRVGFYSNREKPPALGEANLPVARPLPSGSWERAAPSGLPGPREQPAELPAERGRWKGWRGFRV
jgi:hypothetical protein